MKLVGWLALFALFLTVFFTGWGVAYDVYNMAPKECSRLVSELDIAPCFNAINKDYTCKGAIIACLDIKDRQNTPDWAKKKGLEE